MAVAHCGSMRAAAELLTLSQPAVTRVIGMIEADLGTILFRRSHLGTETTDDGRRIVEAGQTAFRHLAEMLEQPCLDTEAADFWLASAFLRQVSDHEIAALVCTREAGSPRRAAGTLGVTQTAVSRSLATLAARLGRPLFENPRVPVLSPWAHDAALKSRRAMAAISAVEQSLRNGGGDAFAPSRLRIGALPASRVHLVPEAARRHSMTCSRLEISIVDAGYEALLSMLHAEEIDVIVGSLRPHSLPDWVAVEVLFLDHLVVVGRPDHPLQRLPGVDWWDLRSARWILPGKPTPIRAEFDRLVTQSAIPAPAQIVEVDSFVAARSFLLSGDWLGIFSASQVIAEERAGLLKRLRMSDVGNPRKVGALTRRARVESPELAGFMGHLRAVAAELALDVPARDRQTPKLIAPDAN